MATEFDEILKNIHGENTETGGLTDSETALITIDQETRTFIFPEGYNKTIAFEGDINSQLITFEMPEAFEGHDLSACGYKKLRWYINDREGTSDLLVNNLDEPTTLTWRVPPAVFVKAGQIHFYISFYDKKDGQVYFSWNTAECSELRVAATMTNVGVPTDEHVTFIPAKNEILIINDETRNIIPPTGYNNLVCNYGDIGVSTVYFNSKRYIRGIDLLGENIEVSIKYSYVSGGGTSVKSGEDSPIEIVSYAAEPKQTDKEELVTIIWNLPKELTCNSERYAGTFNISLCFKEKQGVEIVKSWRTNEYSQLNIGRSSDQGDSTITTYTETDVIDSNLADANTNTYPGVYLHRDVNQQQSLSLQDREIGIEAENGQIQYLQIGGYEQKIPVAAEVIYDAGIGP